MHVYKFVTQPKWLNFYNVVCGRKISNPQCQRGKRTKAPVVEEEPEVETATKTEYIYEDTKCISGVEPEYQWGEIYRLTLEEIWGLKWAL